MAATDGNGTAANDWFDVLVAAFGSKFFWAAVILALLAASGWASPDDVGAMGEKILRAWRCSVP